MPAKGWKSLAVRDEFYAQLVLAAKKENRSAQNYLELKLLENGIIKKVRR